MRHLPLDFLMGKLRPRETERFELMKQNQNPGLPSLYLTSQRKKRRLFPALLGGGMAEARGRLRWSPRPALRYESQRQFQEQHGVCLQTEARGSPQALQVHLSKV